MLALHAPWISSGRCCLSDNPSDAETGIEITRSIPWLLMPWLLASPGHQQLWYSGWETSARPLASASENLAGRVESRHGQVEFCIGYIRDWPVRASAKKFWPESISML